MDSNRVIIRLKSLISFAGVIINEYVSEHEKIHVLKPSDASKVLIYIPQSEIDTIFRMDSIYIKGDNDNE